MQTLAYTRNDVLDLIYRVYCRSHAKSREIEFATCSDERVEHVLRLTLDWAVLQGLEVVWPPAQEIEFEPLPSDDPMDLDDLFQPVRIAAVPSQEDEPDLLVYENYDEIKPGLSLKESA